MPFDVIAVFHSADVHTVAEETDGWSVETPKLVSKIVLDKMEEVPVGMMTDRRKRVFQLSKNQCRAVRQRHL